MNLRRANVADVVPLMRLVRELHRHEGLPEAGAEVSAALERLLAEPRRGRVLVALGRNAPELAGYTILTFGYSLEFHGVDAFIDELFVVDAERDSGVGGLLLDTAEAECRSEGVQALHLESGRGNPAISLYRRRGYVDHDRFLLTKWLHP